MTTATKPTHATFAQHTAEERPHVEKIVSRAISEFAAAGIYHSEQSIRMDIAAVHDRIGLRLAELAEAPAFDFTHDIFGIYGKLDRVTGDLTGCFLPRFAVRECDRPDAETLPPIDIEALRATNGYDKRTHGGSVQKAQGCHICGRDTNPSTSFEVEVNGAGDIIVPGSDPDDSLGCFPVGRECAKRVPAAYVIRD